jgi:hypothetical protein
MSEGGVPESAVLALLVSFFQSSIVELMIINIENSAIAISLSGS